MKITPAFITGMLLSLVATGAFAADAEPGHGIDSTIAAVTVYPDRAVVTRSASVSLKGGVTELVFANLPQALNERSLQVSGRGTAQATILDVSARQTYVDFTPNARVKELEDQLKGLAKQVRSLDDRAGLLQTQEAMLGRMEAALFAPPAKDVPRPDLEQFTRSLKFLTDQKEHLLTERASLDQQREELQLKITAAQNQLNQLRGSGGRAYKTVTVRVSAAQSGSLDVALSYTVPGASWSPNYDARVLSGERSVALGYFGMVRQNTGEDWKDVALTLSTARPGFGGAAPKLAVWSLDLFQPIPLQRGPRSELFAAKSVAGAAPAANEAVALDALSDEAERKDATLATATLESGATSAAFKIAAPASVPSDNSPQKVPITSTKFASNPEYTTVPKRLTTAFLTAKATNTSEFPLLAGAMNVFLDGTFVATSSVRTVMPDEKFDLALGADEGISVKHKRVQKFTEDTGLTNSGKRIAYEYLLTIQNNKKSAERVIVMDQIPISRNEKIVVRQMTPSPGELKPSDEGQLKWTLDLKPGEKRDITVKFTVEYPNEINVAGLE